MNVNNQLAVFLRRTLVYHVIPRGIGTQYSAEFEIGGGGGGRELVLPSESKVIQERQNLLSLLHSFTSQIEAAQLFSKDILKGL